MPMIRPRLPFIRSCMIESFLFVMPGLVPGIHDFVSLVSRRAMAGTSPAMTVKSRISVRERLSGIQPLEYQRGIGAAEPERVRQHGAELGVVDTLAHDRHVGECRIELGDV